MAACLVERGDLVVVYDNLSTGHRRLIPANCAFEFGDIRDSDRLTTVMSETHFDVVMHFAADALVGESIRNPAQYYDNNLVGSLRLTQAAQENGICGMVFSSTCSVYGQPSASPITEATDTRPINPYGETKLAVERLLSWFGQAHGFRHVALRYFNVAGADPAGTRGELHAVETHVILNVLKAALQGHPMNIFGADYSTADGTCVRDYVHVLDVAQAHISALDRLVVGGSYLTLSLGNGAGFSVLEIVNAAREITGRPIPINNAQRRSGDPAVLVADASLAKAELGWSPQLPHIETMIEHAWAWHSEAGFGDDPVPKD